MLADKLIVEATLLSIAPILILNKCDSADAHVVEIFERDYAVHFPTLRVSALTKEGLDGFFTIYKERSPALQGNLRSGNPR